MNFETIGGWSQIIGENIPPDSRLMLTSDKLVLLFVIE